MATGGTVVTSRKQYITFYNTTSLIDKHKNIYFVPRFSQFQSVLAGDEVREAYLKVFNLKAQNFVQYTNIEISNWSPEDRILKIAGNVDDFRTSTEEGHSLNYFILKREVTSETYGTETHYYGFFITDVKQDGLNSVVLTCLPDNFTNVFYLHNKHELTALDISSDYEPFNEKMKNCYVKRQHYNRVRILDVEFRDTFVATGFTGLARIELSSVNPNSQLFNCQVSVEGINVGSVSTNNNVVSFRYDHATIDYEYSALITGKILVPDNMEKFLNTEESYKFKYQYRDLRKSIDFIDNYDLSQYYHVPFSELTTEEFAKIVKKCLAYVAIQTKESLYPRCFQFIRADTELRDLGAERTAKMLKDMNLKLPYPVYLIPTIIIPKELRENLDSTVIEKIPRDFNLHLVNPEGLIVPTGIFPTASIERITKRFGDYILSMTILPINIVEPKSYNIYFNVTGNRWQVELYYKGLVGHYYINTAYTVENKEPSLSPVAIYPDQLDEDGGEYKAQFTYDSEYGVFIPLRNVEFAIKLEASQLSKYLLNIPLQMKNLKTSYFDNIVESEPYSFYTISYNSNETILRRDRFYQEEEYNYTNIDLTLSITVNQLAHISLIPSYKVNNHKYLYTNESLSFNEDNQLPITVSSLESYYWRNMSQLKNQYLVNDYNRMFDLGQTFFNTAPAQVGAGFISGGQPAGFAQLVKQTSGMLDNMLDWRQSTRVIEMNQKAKLADVGRQPDSVTNTCSEILSIIQVGEVFFYLNHYIIDELSYNSIAKFLERFGYQVSLYDSLHTVDRVGWNYIELINFDYEANITVTQEEAIKEIFMSGVTLLHDSTYLTSGHNFETILEGGD